MRARASAGPGVLGAPLGGDLSDAEIEGRGPRFSSWYAECSSGSWTGSVLPGPSEDRGRRDGVGKPDCETARDSRDAVGVGRPVRAGVVVARDIL